MSERATDDTVYDFDTVVDRRHDPFSYSVKWGCDPHVASHCGVSRITDEHIPLFTADMDFRCAEPILDAFRKTVDHGIFGYSSEDRDGRYREAVRSWFSRRDGWDIDTSRMLFCPGTVNALRYAVEAFTDPGDAVIIQRPVYPPFTGVLVETGRTLLDNHLVRHTDADAQGDLYCTMDFDGLEELASRDDAKLLILCNPHNPVGRVWHEDELRRLADICIRHGVMVLADEIHGDLMLYGNRICHFAAVAPEARSLTCTATNKTFNLAGVPATNVVFSSGRDMRAFRQFTLHSEPSPFAISSVIAAYNEGENWLTQCLRYIEDNVDMVVDYFGEHLPDVGVRKPEGTYILWFDFTERCRKLGIDGAELHRRIYEDAKVILQDGTNFDPEGGAFFQRMVVPSPRSVIRDACERIARVLA